MNLKSKWTVICLNLVFIVVGFVVNKTLSKSEWDKIRGVKTILDDSPEYQNNSTNW